MPRRKKPIDEDGMPIFVPTPPSITPYGRIIWKSWEDFEANLPHSKKEHFDKRKRLALIRKKTRP